MNFLAHLHLATLSESSLIGNLVADYVRGDPYKQYNATIADGMMMHRRLDKLIDEIDIVKSAKNQFSKSHIRVAPIALDVVWDHFLAKNWSQFSPQQTLTEFCQDVQKTIKPDVLHMSADIQEFNYFLWQEKWLEGYVDIEFIGEILRRMAKRRPKLGALATIFPEICQHYPLLHASFDQFYPTLMARAAQRQL